MNEQELLDYLTKSVGISLAVCGLELLGPVDVQVYRRWDRRSADIVIKAKVDTGI